MKTYELQFLVSAKKEWDKLDNTVRQQLKRKLVERLANPRVESARLATMPDCYKIKLVSSGYRLVYQVVDRKITVVVIAIGKRERKAVYSIALGRVPQ
ncbi:addiction module toxin RelE [Burkholderia sp. Leaf177]|uniref:type II toxin-antitoxin system RelE family toxin n=1 Tax=Burkholderia sp. Leaf177 TaxID=1736287 RepID=UPI0006F6EEFB|nr:type II toxin-antitoxin system RelE/ParE family toxin [Burkholderia sp. Leaf177]KQR89774.1 addiction module toxin RelE [Burkholderia sp. Leaf177]